MCTTYSTAAFRANAVKDNISLGSVDKRENSISSLILFSETELNSYHKLRIQYN